MWFVQELLEAILWRLLGGWVYFTGEAIRFVFTLGGHRMRWWDSEDMNASWPSLLLGTSFWAAVIAVLVLS